MGVFIARVARGRTVREFVVCVILLLALLCTLWMAAFGGTAISRVIIDGARVYGGAPIEVQCCIVHG